MFKRILFTGITSLFFSCTGKLDIKPDQSKNIPKTVADYQALLDNYDMVNISIPVHGEVGADNYYITDARYNALTTESQRNAYIWGDNIFPPNDIALDWAGSYLRISYCNLVLEGLEKLPDVADGEAYNNVKGTALFLRAYSFYTLAEVFSKPYDSATAASDLGVPLRLTASLETIYQRASVKETYDQIFADLDAALTLLPDHPLVKIRPSKTAVHALLSRIYLGLMNYERALYHADKALALYPDLLNYNTVEGSGQLSFEPFNKDVLFHALLSTTGLFRINNTSTDSVLYRQFEENDLRKTLFFEMGAGGLILFKGSYSGNAFSQFGGIAVDEIYLNRAECYARKGDVTRAMEDLNTLLKTRWKAGTYVDMTAANPDDALVKVLTERRKELIFRGVRWTDLRRLNRDPRFSKIITRKVNGTVYQLLPNSPRYVFPIPEDEIRLSGIQQNVR
jgi:tetratricopeptide (TPR) repeat protein